MSVNYGFVYVLRNDCMPGIYKIGMTDRAPSQRCEELSRSTSVPKRFDVVCFAEVDDAKAVERGLHEAFARSRVSRDREFFRLDKAGVTDLIDQIRRQSALVATGSLDFLSPLTGEDWMLGPWEKEFPAACEWYDQHPSNPKNNSSEALVEVA